MKTGGFCDSVTTTPASASAPETTLYETRKYRYSFTELQYVLSGPGLNVAVKKMPIIIERINIIPKIALNSLFLLWVSSTAFSLIKSALLRECIIGGKLKV